MSMTDPIADLLTRIRNAIIAKHDRLDIPMSKVKLAICKILEEEGLISSCRTTGDNPLSQQIQVILRYSHDGESAIRRIQRVSKPGRRVYKGADDIQPVLSGLGVGILSTSKGLVTDKKARELRVGGEVLCEIW
jgi:small subunit ribosomal protein S8